jgi:catechol 2,3-dioxygenase
MDFKKWGSKPIPLPVKINAAGAMCEVRAVEHWAIVGMVAASPTMPNPAPSTPIHPETRIGHVHLKVADIERSLAFYCGVLGFELLQRFGTGAAFISAGGYHHHIGLNTWESLGGKPPPPGSTGLFHVAILYPNRAELADALARLIAAKIPLDGAADHGVSEALYLRDPDQNGVELYVDRPREEWPRGPKGELAMYTHSLDLDALLAGRKSG